MTTWLPILRRRGCPPLFYSYINYGYKDLYHQELLGISRGIRDHRYVDGWVVIGLEDSNFFTAEFSQRLAEPAYQEFFLRQCRRLSDELFRVGDRLKGANYVEATNGRLLVDFMEFSSSSIRTMPFLTSMVILQGSVETHLKEELARAVHADLEDPLLDELLQNLMLDAPEVPLATTAVRELNDIARGLSSSQAALISELKSAADSASIREVLAETDSNLLQRIDRYLEEYDFLTLDYYVGEPMSLKDVADQLSSLLSAKPSNPEPSSIVSSLALTPEAKGALAGAQELHFLRQHRIEAMFKSGRDARGMLTAIGERLGLSFDEVLHMTFDEIQRSLGAGQLQIPYPAIAERMVDYGVEIIDGVDRLVTGNDLQALRSSVPGDAPESKILRGTTAFTGSYVGPATVVTHHSDLHRVSSGDVLIAPMTSPYHVPAMIKAGAVVTDEGGILSHAAIVSRELGIPCIVGVQGATSLIRDDSRVAVTARPGAGIVEILS
jgi:phosphohistidine swiveling domain-containing protein